MVLRRQMLQNGTVGSAAYLASSAITSQLYVLPGTHTLQSAPLSDFKPQSVLSFFALIYFILATGPSPQARLLPWFIWGQLGLDALMFILWLAAAASSSYNCSDLCNACSAYSVLSYDTDVCFCVDNTGIFKRTYSPKPKGVLHARSPKSYLSGVSGSRSSSGGRGSILAARQAFDAIMTCACPSA